MSWSPHRFGFLVPTECNLLPEFPSNQAKSPSCFSSAPKDQGACLPARAAYSHSASLGRRQAWFSQNFFASYQVTAVAGRLGRAAPRYWAFVTSVWPIQNSLRVTLCAGI